MIYENIILGKFISRPNRFIAHVEIGGAPTPCHVKNTSRLRELLLPGTAVSVQRADAPGRKTQYDLIAVEHEGRWVNIDSQAPNKVFGEWLLYSGYYGDGAIIRPETVYGKSRFDYYIEAGGRRIFVEVKGVTLVEDGMARFPGAPTLRGVKHVQELAQCIGEGYEAMIVFIVKRDDVTACAPNDELDPAFGKALRAAAGQGVQVMALDCEVAPDSLMIRDFVKVIL